MPMAVQKSMGRCKKMTLRKPKVCFISLYAYAVLTQKNLGVTGGAELQQALLAKELIKKGVDVSFVTFDFGQKGTEEYDTIKIFKTLKKTFLINSNICYIMFASLRTCCSTTQKNSIYSIIS